MTTRQAIEQVLTGKPRGLRGVYLAGSPTRTPLLSRLGPRPSSRPTTTWYGPRY